MCVCVYVCVSMCVCVCASARAHVHACLCVRIPDEHPSISAFGPVRRYSCVAHKLSTPSIAHARESTPHAMTHPAPLPTQRHTHPPPAAAGSRASDARGGGRGSGPWRPRCDDVIRGAGAGGVSARAAQTGERGRCVVGCAASSCW